MVFTLPVSFQAKPDQSEYMAGDVVDAQAPAALVSSVSSKGKEGTEKMVFEKPSEDMTQHLRPLYINVHMNGSPVPRVLVDNGAAVNILPSSMLKTLGKTEKDLIPSEVTVANFSGGITKAKGVLPIYLAVGNRESLSAFFVVDSTSSYNALLGRDWIHSNCCVPSSLHQFLIFWNGDKVEIVKADQKPFLAGSNSAEAYLYGEEVGPIKFVGTDKYGNPKKMTTEVDSFPFESVERVMKEMDRPNVIIPYRPVQKCIIEEIP